MKSRAERQLELQRFDRWLVRFSKEAPVLFWFFCAGLGCATGGVLLIALDFLDKVKP